MKPRRRRIVLISVATITICADLASLPLNGHWYVGGLGDVTIRFGIMTITNPNEAAFSDASKLTTYIPVLAWTWSHKVHVRPGRYAMETGHLGGSGNAKAPSTPLRHNLPSGTLQIIDACTLASFPKPRFGPWRRVSSSCPESAYPTEQRPMADWFTTYRYGSP